MNKEMLDYKSSSKEELSIRKDFFEHYKNNPIPTFGNRYCQHFEYMFVFSKNCNITTFRYQLISEGIMLFGNYYALFKLVRDYIVFWRFFVVDNNKEQRSKD